MPDPPVHRIAVVDDNERTRRLLVDMLELSGYYVMPFSSGEAILAEQRTERWFDLMLLDIDMPGLDGFAVAREVRQQLHLDQMKILVVTGLSDPHDAAKVLEVGADAYISKPVNVSEVLALVKKLLGDQPASGVEE